MNSVFRARSPRDVVKKYDVNASALESMAGLTNGRCPDTVRELPANAGRPLSVVQYKFPKFDLTVLSEVASAHCRLSVPKRI